MVTPPTASISFTKPIRLTTTAPSTWSPVSSPTAPSSALKPRAKSDPGYGYALGRFTASRPSALRRFGYGKQGHEKAFADSGGSGTFSRLRGMPYIAARPVARSTSRRIIVSVRRLQRPVPASAPTSSTFSLPSAAHWAGSVLGRALTSIGNIGMPSPVVGPAVGATEVNPAGSGEGLPPAELAGLGLSLAAGPSV